MKRRLAIAIAIFLCAANSVVLAESATEIYQRRILPLLKSPASSSCSDCHLQGLDLKQFLHEDPQRTFIELRARGWVDIDKPENSKLLEFISKSPDNSSDLQEKVRNAEFDAMRNWIHAAASDPSFLSIPVAKLDDLGFESELVRHGRTDQILERFVTTIWSQLERCANCHSPDRNQKHREKHGESMSWIVPKSPSRTLQLLLEKKLIDVDSPAKSPLRTKAIGEDSHGGGIKFPIGGKTDDSWLAFLTDLSKIKKGEYRSAKGLPSPLEQRGWRSSLHLRIANFPSEWNGLLLQLTLHRRRDDGTFAETPSAWTESRVSSERRSWGNSLSLLLETANTKGEEPIRSIEISEALPEGVYEARIVCSKSKLEASKVMPTQSKNGRFEIVAPWSPGHATANEVEFGSIRFE